MPRKKTDIASHNFFVDPATLDALDVVAAHHGWLTEAGSYKGQPNRSLAVRELAKREAEKIRGIKP